MLKHRDVSQSVNKSSKGIVSEYSQRCPAVVSRASHGFPSGKGLIPASKIEKNERDPIGSWPRRPGEGDAIAEDLSTENAPTDFPS